VARRATWLLQLPWLSSAEQREALLRELVGVNLERMLREMGEFLDRYTEGRPLLLVTEDLHWGDRATIQLIDYLARRRSRGSLMWLSSFRLAEVIASDHLSTRYATAIAHLCEEIVPLCWRQRSRRRAIPAYGGDELRRIHDALKAHCS
jgi:hypothetical protein